MSKCCQLFSGSKGNCIYISCGDTKILIDAGVSAKRITTALAEIGVDAKDIDAIFVTHEHTDHISGIRVFATKNNVPVFAHPDVLAKMRYTGHITDDINATAITEKIDINGNKITPFLNSHDSVACYGYRLDMTDKRSISICTDTGYVTDDAKEKIAGSDLVFLESNHEVTMLLNGPYTYPLKQRILSPNGHLSNYAASEYAAELVKSGTKWLVLAHLSQENNMPELAYQATVSSLHENGYEENVDYRLYISSPQNNERPIVI